MDINTKKLEILAIKNGFNYKMLADKANVSRQTLSTIKGRKSCAIETAIKLAAALNVDITELLED